MNLTDVLPALRPVEILPINDDADGDEAFFLRDPQRLADHGISVSRPVLFLLQFLDGKTQAATLAEKWREATDGQELPMEQVESVLQELDRMFLLDNDNSRDRLAEMKMDFAADTTREHRFGEDEAAVGEVLDMCYQAAGLPPVKQTANEANDLAALVAPHIDYFRGGAAWAAAYNLAKRRFAGDVVVVLGVNHQMHDQPIALTKKTFATPFGEVKTATDLVDELAAALPFDAYADEFAHRDEHSVELAVTALKHAYGDACPTVVPVLCGSFEPYIAQDIHPGTVPGPAAFTEALRSLVERLGERVLVVASVDFAHIGPQFGAAEPLTDDAMSASLAADQELLRIVTEHDADGFYRSVCAEGNARHLCGVAPIFYSLAVVPTRSAPDAGLYFWRAEDDSGAVSFAVAGLRR